MKLLDTNVIIYAVGKPHPLKDACARLLREVAAGNTDYNVDAELLQEILYVYLARGERQLGLATFDDLLVLFPAPIPIGRDVMSAARHLLGRYPSLSPRDAVHAAAAQTHGFEGIVSSDLVFDRLEEVARFDPLHLYPA
ncbi:MAG: type II toxin-antitoxin system VapC family toxin [Chloroflexi bacterium]|nr:type II toxin-antitoxin system VapC family toxin [Chloroflexota bacterium]